MHEFNPKIMLEINSVLETHDHTYYFSISSSVRGKRVLVKMKEALTEPSQTAKMGAGYDISTSDNIKFSK
jgi:hypothetical protein